MAVYRDLDGDSGILSPGEKQALLDATAGGELIVIPTDTIYGIGADPHSRFAVSRLLGAKGRDQTMPPPVLGAYVEELLSMAKFSSAAQEQRVATLVEAFWPGPLTMVVHAGVEPGWDTDSVGGTIALRMPDCAEALAVLKITGPLAVTSANRTGMPPARSVDEARQYFGEEVAVYVDGGVSTGTAVSTILDCTGEDLRVIRLGAVSREQISSILPTGT